MDNLDAAVYCITKHLGQDALCIILHVIANANNIENKNQNVWL